MTATWNKTPVVIEIQPWFGDHRFNGKVVLPAVETMARLAGEAPSIAPGVDIRVMEQVRFARFLEIPAGSREVEALIEWKGNEDGSLLVRLFSRTRFKAMSRLQEHGEVLFSPAQGQLFPPAAFCPEPPTEPEFSVPAQRVYRELVPFGPAYHTLQGSLHLGGKEAWGRLQAPLLPVCGRAATMLGSPFPLDGAFHAACVLGQRRVDFVPFPVGFSRRIISRPTQPGTSYRVRVKLLSQSASELLFDLTIVDEQGQVCEQVTGLRMRDVSGGTIRPPEWIKG